MVAVSRVGDRTADKSADWAIYTVASRVVDRTVDWAIYTEETAGVAAVGSWSRGSEMENVSKFTFNLVKLK